MYKLEFVNREEEKGIGHICVTLKDVREMTVHQNHKSKIRDERNAKRKLGHRESAYQVIVRVSIAGIVSPPESYHRRTVLG